jgi:potassium-transporting ATPase KdpC subunit
MIKQLVPSIILTIVLMVLTGLAYPLAITGAAQALFPRQAHGSLIEKDGTVVGSDLIAQGFAKPQYFHPRPSATSDAAYNAANSGGSNAAPTSKSTMEGTLAVAAAIRAENPNARIPLPVDLVTASASGLDPHISPAAAEYQVPRIAAARKMTEADLRQLVEAHTKGRLFGVLGEATVNVLELNLALDDRGR